MSLRAVVFCVAMALCTAFASAFPSAAQGLDDLAAAEAALDDDAFVRRTREVNAAGIAQLSAGLKQLGFAFIDGKANFLAAQIPKAEEAFTTLQKAGVIVRPLRGYGMTGWLRLTVGTEAQNARLLAELAKL